jgi:hypothetical protein
MNNILKALVLTLISSQVFANSNTSLVKNIVNNISHPNDYITQSDDNNYWFAYSVPAHNQNTLNCCWDQSSKKHSKTKACDLSKKNNGFVNQKSDLITQSNNIFIHVKNKKVNQILPISEHCEVKLEDSSIAWLNDVNELKSIDFFKQLSINASENIADESLYAMTMHDHKKATQELYELALMDKNKISENAVFWLGASRKDGFNKLENLYNNLPRGKTKKHVNFALAQSSDPQSLELLKQIAINDKNSQQRSDALFWLAEKAPEQTKNIIINQLKSGDNTMDVEHSVFTLSRLAEGRGDDTLFELLKGQYTKQVKKQALFWLSQSENNETINKLQKML